MWLFCTILHHFSLEYLSVRSVQTETFDEKEKVHIEQRFQYIFLMSQCNTFKNPSLMTICTRDRQLSLRHWDSYQNFKGKVEIYCYYILYYNLFYKVWWILDLYIHFNIFSVQELFKWLNFSFYHCFWWCILLPSSNLFFFIFS